MPRMLKGLSKLMNESMNTMTDWVKEEWKDRGMAGGGPGDECPGRPEARRTQLEEAGFWVRKGSAAVCPGTLGAEPEPTASKCSPAACRACSSYTVKP